MKRLIFLICRAISSKFTGKMTVEFDDGEIKSIEKTEHYSGDDD